VPGGDGVVHSVEVTGTSVFQFAAAGIAQMREEGWICARAGRCGPSRDAARVGRSRPVPKALQASADGPSTRPKLELVTNPLRAAPARDEQGSCRRNHWPILIDVKAPERV
jgi:hypothetical protein